VTQSAGRSDVEILKTNQVLDEIIEARRSVRAFTTERPPRDDIELIIRAGMAAPYPAIAVGGRDDFRRFFVFQSGTPSMERAAELMKDRARLALEGLRRETEARPALKGRAQPFLDRLEAANQRGIFPLGLPPYFIVVAELRGIPLSARESLAHTLQNMWLKTTALGLGFQLISLTEQMSDDPGFLGLLGLAIGEFELNGCAVGYPRSLPPATSRPDPLKLTRWMA
jgi:nitroreductase